MTEKIGDLAKNSEFCYKPVRTKTGSVLKLEFRITAENKFLAIEMCKDRYPMYMRKIAVFCCNL